jgi:aarF domain-containing kinase
VVAVKVRHPGVEEAISRDFALMLATVDYLQFYFPNTDLTTIEESVYQFRGPLFEQTDLELEAQHLCTFRENFRGNRRISFPKALYPYCTSEVLVESFEPGKSIQEYVDIRRGIPFRKTIPVQGLNVLMQMMLKDNLIHADLHPGNVLVRLEEPSLAARLWDLVWGAPLSSPVPNIVLLDVGMAAEMLQEDRSTLGKLFLGTVELDGPMVGEATLELGGSRGPFRSLASDLPVAGAVSEFSPAEVAEKTAAFQKDVNLLFDSLKEFDRTFNRLPPPAECMYDLLEIVRQHHVSIKNEISIVIATTFVLEGWATRMDPDLQIIEIIGEHVRPPWSVAWNKFLILTGLRKRRDPPPNVDDYD